MGWLKLSDRYINFDAVVQAITKDDKTVRLIFNASAFCPFIDVVDKDAKAVITFLELNSN